MSHGALLRQWSDDPELASHVMHDYKNADLDAATKGMLEFAAKLTREPDGIRESDVNGLRSYGLDDQQILSVVLITCLFNFMTRLAGGLGVRLEDVKQHNIDRWLTGPATEQEWMVRAAD